MFNNEYSLTQSVLEGWKTMTRRVIKGKNFIARHWNPVLEPQHCYYKDERGMCQFIDADTDKIIKPKYEVGEVVAIAQCYRDFYYDEHRSDRMLQYHPLHKAGWTNKMFVKADLMPYRIRITKVRIQRLQDISDVDCMAEGINYYEQEGFSWCSTGELFDTPREAFTALMDKVSGKGTWDSNPFCFVYEFELLNQ